MFKFIFSSTAVFASVLCSVFDPNIPMYKGVCMHEYISGTLMDNI